MAITTGKAFGLGLARAWVLELNANGTPKAVGTTPYQGIEMVGPQDLTLTIPDAQKKTHLGNNQPLQVDFLPPTEAISATIKCSEDDQALYAVLTGTKRLTLGDATMVGWGTNVAGFEPQVALIVSQQALDENGVRNWITCILPKCVVYPHRGSMDANPSVHTFQIAPAFVQAHLWGTVFSLVNEGYTRAQLCMWQTRYPLAVVSWLPGVQSAGYNMLFPATAQAQAASAGKASCFKNEAAQIYTTDYTVKSDLTAITEVASIVANDRFVCAYEHPEPA